MVQGKEKLAVDEKEKKQERRQRNRERERERKGWKKKRRESERTSERASVQTRKIKIGRGILRKESVLSKKRRR